MAADKVGTPFPPLPAEPVGFRQVFTEELKRVVQWRKNRDSAGMEPKTADPFEAAQELGLFGVSLSGGGIRSATFNLGVLQTMARLKMLHHVDYLSTVSGGGYIGSWLSAMIHRERSIKGVESGLDPGAIKHNTLPQKAIAHLRTFSNYLTPKVSMLSADTWTLWTIWSRNTLLNLVILVACTTALAAAVRGIRFWGWTEALGFAEILCGTLVVWTTVWFGLGLAGRKMNDGRVQQLVICPSVGVSLLGAWLIAKGEIRDDIVINGLVLSVVFGALSLCAGFLKCFTAQHPKQKALFWPLWIVTAVGSGFAASSLLHVGHLFIAAHRGWDDYPWFVLTLAPPAVMLAFTLGVIVTIGVMGRDIPDDRREWSGRLAAWGAIYTVGWLMVFGAVIYGPVLIKLAEAWARSTITAAWIATTVASLLAGNSEKTDGSTNGSTGIRIMNLIAVIGPWVFMGGFFVAVSLGVHELATGAMKTAGAPSGAWDRYWAEMAAQTQWKDFSTWGAGGWHQGLWDLFLVCGAIGLFASWRVDINEFSLHHFYKNRLVRCYMGASRSERHPNPFTGFDGRDDLRLNYFDIEEYQGPFPILNATLNLSSGRNLAWQERKGASFIFTPVYSGYDSGGRDSGTSVSRQMRIGDVKGDAYWPTRLLSKSEDDDQDAGGIAIGTAAAISGAAASPNQGYHTSTAVAFLMTVFNTRLGWWLGNTADKEAADWTSPMIGLKYMLMELFGSTSAQDQFINLADGGFFDNMGLYELVRRRCKYIVVCDAEQDGDLNFGGITQAIRMCRTDFGVEIELPLEAIRRNAAGWSGVHSAVGRIHYKPLNAGTAPVKGVLIYLKSSLTGTEPSDVIGYRRVSPEFPHETTGDQWFSESQFESYRKLGEYIAKEVFAGPSVAAMTTAADKDAFFQSIEAA